MIETQEFDKYPVFGEAAAKTAPDAARYSGGFQPADVLPAEWLNWAWGKNSKGISDLNAGVVAMEAELNAILEEGGLVADNTGKQVTAAIKNIILKKTGTLASLNTVNKSTIVAACNEILSEIRKESQNRQSAMTSLTQAFQQAINTEAQARINGDKTEANVRNNAINTEAQARAQGDKSIVDFGDLSGNHRIQVGFLGMGLTAETTCHLAGFYNDGKGDRGNKLRDISKEETLKFLGLEQVNNSRDYQKSVKYAETAGSAQADGGNADTVCGFKAGNGVNMLVPVVAFNVGENAGYIKLGNGLIVQWGHFYASALRATLTIPIAFTSWNSYTVVTADIAHYNNDNDTEGFDFCVGINKRTNKTIDFSIAERDREIHWLCIGF